MVNPTLAPASLIGRLNHLYYYYSLVLVTLIPMLFFTNIYPFQQKVVYHPIQNVGLGIIAVLLFMLGMKFYRSTSLEDGVSNGALYLKLVNLVLLYCYATALETAVYLLACLVMFFVVVQPSYSGPSRINFLEETTYKRFISEKGYRILLLQVHWSPRCLNFQAVVASLSLRFTTYDLKFGSLELDQDEELAAHFKVDNSVTSLQLPTLLLYQDGKEIKRLPNLTTDTKPNKRAMTYFDRSEETVVKEFDLESLYNETITKLDE